MTLTTFLLWAFGIFVVAVGVVLILVPECEAGFYPDEPWDFDE